MSLATKIGNIILKIETIKQDKNKFINKIIRTIKESTITHKKTQNKIESLLLEFQNKLFTINTIIIFILIIFILILSYKVEKNVSISFDEIEEQVRDGLEEINNLNNEISDTQREVVFTMGAIGESRSKETGNHVRRVAEYSKLLASLHGLSDEESEMLKQASLMHDIGKVAIPDAILNKPARLNEEERLITR